MITKPKAGAYRDLFKAGLIELLKQGKLSNEQQNDALYYLRLLEDPDYMFGSIKAGRVGTDYFRS